MKPLPRTFTTSLRVRYAETDQMGVVYHANYLVWFEVGRVEMMRELGFAYQRLEMEEGCVLPVVEVNCRYRQPARYDDELELRTRLAGLRGPVLRFGYELHRIAGGAEAGGADAGGSDVATSNGSGSTLLAEGTTTHLVVDRSLRRRALPPDYAEALRACLGELPVGGPAA